MYSLPSKLAQAADPNWLYPPHIQRLESLALQAIHSQYMQRLLVSIACRHGKTEFLSYILPAWYLLRYPERRVILVTHSGRFSEFYGHRIRELISRFSNEHASLDKNYKARSDFRMQQGGGLLAIGWGGGITGRGANLLLLDDLIRDQAEALSEGNREKMKMWLFADAMSRLEPGGRVVGTLSRRHPDDIVGMCLNNNINLEPEEKWHEYRMPALDENGIALWPARYSAEKLNKIKLELESAGQGFIWHCLYMQEPIDPHSCAFPAHWFDNILIDEPPVGNYNLISVDPSKARQKGTGDPAAAVVININKATNKITVIDGFSEKIPANEVVSRTLELIKLHKPKAVSMETIDLQVLLLQDLEKRLIDEKLIHNTLLRTYEPKNDKDSRIELTLAPFLAQGRIKIVKKPCLIPLVDELKYHPNNTHDDFADALTQSVWLATSLL